MNKIVVIYDSECAFCRWSVNLMQGWDAHSILRFLPCRSPEREKEFPEIAEKECLEAMQAMFKGGSHKSGFDAIAHIMRRLTGWQKLVGFIMVYTPGMALVGRAVYRWIAKNRYKIRCDNDRCHI